MQRWTISAAALASVIATATVAADTFLRAPLGDAPNGGSSAQSLEPGHFESRGRNLNSFEAVQDTGLEAARAHLEAGANDAAVEGYRAAVARIQTDPGYGDMALVAALTGLGTALLRTGDESDGIATLEHAVQVSRRAGGLFNLAQLESLETLASVHAEAGRFEVADSLYRYIVQIHVQHYGAEDAKTAAAITTLAAFKRGAGHYLDARTLYRRAISMIERHRGPSAPELIAPLAGLADVYRREALGMVDFEPAPETISAADKAAVLTRSDLLSAGARKHAYNRRLHPAGLRTLNRALKIAQRRIDEVDPPTYHALLVQTGDWLLLARKASRAMRQYERALEIEAEAKLKAEALDQVVPIYLAVPTAATRHKWLPPEAVHETYTEIEFTVSETGSVEDARVVDSNASDADNRAALRAFHHSIYRPRFVGGAPVETRGVRHRFVFRKRM